MALQSLFVERARSREYRFLKESKALGDGTGPIKLWQRGVPQSYANLRAPNLKSDF